MIKDPYVGVWIHPETTSPFDMVGRKDNQDIAWLADHVDRLIAIQPTDNILDLCCGNGLLTAQLAKKARSITGVDYSAVLLKQAQEISSADNIQYLEGDARNLLPLLGCERFDKVVISFAFQYFDYQTSEVLFGELAKLIAPTGRIAILDIPDRSKKLSHMIRAAIRVLTPSASKSTPSQNKRFQSMESRIRYILRNIAHLIGLPSSHDELGWWWKRNDLIGVAGKHGFHCHCLDIPPESSMSRYRFDAVLSPKSNLDLRQGIHAASYR